ncbi:hypothetical protein [Ruegeria atlantica]|uniref:hypothetical protein n=1 Tax=Ruegeria atlantica TaxID=81569 RepID=UPI001481AA71|nr:hypothetical protein [Ruegeria atlantica]
MSNENPDQGDQNKDYSKRIPLEALSRVSEKINEKAGGLENDKCPVCGSAHNTVLETEYSIPVGQTEPLVGIGPHVPSYATACLNCGYLRFFSKLILDRIIASEAAPREEGGDENG